MTRPARRTAFATAGGPVFLPVEPRCAAPLDRLFAAAAARRVLVRDFAEKSFRTVHRGFAKSTKSVSHTATQLSLSRECITADTHDGDDQYAKNFSSHEGPLEEA